VRVTRYYWEIRYYLESRYFKRKYAKLPAAIYYDHKHHTYVNPKLLGEIGCCEYVCGETAKSGCMYHYYLGETLNHEHSIGGVFLAAYNDSEKFSIAEEDEAEYSNQELAFIKKLVECGRRDRGC
jgi:hypothetical protein